MAVARSQSIRSLFRFVQIQPNRYPLGSFRSYSNAVFSGSHSGQVGISSFLYNNRQKTISLHDSMKVMCTVMDSQLAAYICQTRSATTQVQAPAQQRQMGSAQVSLLSPGIIYEPYAPREPIPFWKRWFTRSGWKRTKEDVILELKSAYAIQKLRKSGYSKQKFYVEAYNLYKEINTLVATGNRKSLRKYVTEKMFSSLKNEIKRTESMWNSAYWELIQPAIKIRTLRARLIGVDKSNLNKVFIQLTLEFTTKQKFEAYNSTGAVVAGDKSKEMDRREDELQSLGICRRIFYFLVKALTAHAIKPVTLGNPTHQLPESLTSSKNELEPDSESESVILVELVEFDSVSSINGSLVLGEQARESAPVQKRAPKKMVSINDEAEVIDLGKKRRKLALEKQTSTLTIGDSIESRPLKSILRVGSSLK